MLGSLFLLAATLMTLMGLGPIEAGIAMLGLRLTQSGWARKTAGIVESIGARHAHLLGLGGMAVGCASFLRLGPSPDYVTDVLPGLVVLGLSAPFVFVTGSILTHQCTHPSESGLAAGILGSCQWLGGSLGVAVVSACLAAYGEGDATGIRAGFAVCAASAATAMVIAGLATRNQPRPAASRDPSAHQVRDDRPTAREALAGHSATLKAHWLPANRPCLFPWPARIGGSAAGGCSPGAR